MLELHCSIMYYSSAFERINLFVMEQKILNVIRVRMMPSMIHSSLAIASIKKKKLDVLLLHNHLKISMFLSFKTSWFSDE
jgi:3-oxoacyl-[acyl-carrier-protein] synthase III